MEKIKHNGLILTYQTFGNPQDPSIILLHGNSSSSAIFQRQFTDLYKGYHLVAPDFYGHGSSGLPDDLFSYSIKGLGEEITMLIDHLNINDFIIYGVSLGGHVAIELVPYSKNLKGIMFSGTPPLPKPFNIENYFTIDNAAQTIFKPKVTDVESIAWGKACIYQNSTLENEVAALMRQTSPDFRERFSRTVTDLVGIEDEKKIVERANIPIAIIEGQYEDRINNEYLRELKIHNLFQNEIIRIADSIHYPNMENPIEFNNVLKSFADYCFE